MNKKHGFTLVELLIVVTVMLILATMTVIGITSVLDGERVREGSRIVQWFVEGARNRALFAAKTDPTKIGVEFLVDPLDPTVANAMILVQSGPRLRGDDIGQIILERRDDNLDGQVDGYPGGSYRSEATVVHGLFYGTWWNLKQQGLLRFGSRITIIDNTDHRHEFSVLTDLITGPGQQYQKLIIPQGFPTTGNERSLAGPNPVIVYGGDGPTRYELELPLITAPNAEPVNLPYNVVVDLDHSRIPARWKDAFTGNYRWCTLAFGESGYFDGIGNAGQVVHLLLADRADTDVGMPPDTYQWSSTPIAPYTVGSWVIPSGPRNGFMYKAISVTGPPGNTEPTWPKRDAETVVDGSVTWEAWEIHDKKIISLYPGTGRILSSSVFEYDSTNSWGQPDPFRYAEEMQ